jgi:hypothetical protein
VSVKEILRQGKVAAPGTAHEMLAELNKYSSKNLSDPKSLK